MTNDMGLTLADIMSRQIAHVAPGCSLVEAANQMAERRISSLLVMEGNAAAGILTERDILKHFRDEIQGSTPVSELMSKPVLTAPQTLDFASAYSLAMEHHVRHLVVVNGGGEVVGIASETDFRSHIGTGLLDRLSSLRTVADVELPLLSPADTLSKAIEEMVQKKVSYMLVVTEDDRPLGILTERDIPSLMSRGVEPDKTLLADVMHTPVRTISEQISVVEASHQMLENRMRHLVVVDGEGKVVGILTQHRLLERIGLKLIEETWRTRKAEAESWLQFAMDAANLGLWEYDVVANRCLWNNKLCELLGMGVTEAPKSFDEYVARIHPDDRTAVLANLNERFSYDKPLSEIEYRLLRKDGSWLWVSDRGKAIVRETEGMVLLVTGTIIDISRRKQAEEKLLHLNETLEVRVREQVASNREKDHVLIEQSRLAAMGEMVHNIAHQWRQPLNALAILLANIKDAHEFNELDGEFIDKSMYNGQHLIQKMSTTIDDFRNFFKPNKVKSLFSLYQAVEEVKAILGASLASHNIRLEVVEHGGKAVQAFGFANEFAQVLLNLVNNAKDAILAKNIKFGHILLDIREEGGRAVLRIKDNGGGIPEKILPKIYDPYFTTKGKGTGIGLYMSKMIMDHMDGSIDARNVAGGAEFVLILPDADKAPREAP